MKTGWTLLAVLAGGCCCRPPDARAQGGARAARPPVQVVKSQPVKPQAVQQARAAYVWKVGVISNQLKPLWTRLLVTFEHMEALTSEPKRRSRRAAAAEQDDAREELAKLKASLRATIQEIRVHTKRLRAISPVPRSLRKADNELVDCSLEMEQGLESLAAWADSPSHELGLQAGRQLRKASTSFSTVSNYGIERVHKPIQGAGRRKRV